MKKILTKIITAICIITIVLPNVFPLSNTIVNASSWDQIEPYSIIENEENIELLYKVTEEELDQIEQYYGTSSSITPYGTSYSSFPNPGTAFGIASIIAGRVGFINSAVALGVAGLIFDRGPSTIYYTYTQTSWRESNGRFHVSVRMNFYGNSSYTYYLTGTTFTRTYEVWE